MRKQNTNRAIPLDAVSERRTKRCSRDFGLVVAFVGCDSNTFLSVGYASDTCFLTVFWSIWTLPKLTPLNDLNAWSFNVELKGTG